jgi:REP element-mobilizing transposase RayT
MSMRYDPEIHHRRSIRLKGHDYAGGGVYFVTICAHRDAGNVFAEAEAKKIVAERLRITEEKFPEAQWKEWVIMPDHFHALIQMDGGGLRLGDIIGGFKSAVSRELRRSAANGVTQASPVRRGEVGLAPRIWHRNYYEMIVRTPEAARAIAGYIQMNPWRCVMDFGGGLRGMGNPVLWTAKKLGVLCSRNAPQGIGKDAALTGNFVALSGFHSPLEQEVFKKLLECKRSIIWCPAWGLDRTAAMPAVREALEENRLLILEMRNCDGDLAAAEQRNRFVLECADELWLPHVTRGGMLDRLIRELRVEEKVKA